MRQFQTVYDETADAILGPGHPRPTDGEPVTTTLFERAAAPTADELGGAFTGNPARRVPTFPSRPTPKEDPLMYDYDDNCDSKNLGGEDLKKVIYSIWLKKPDYEALLVPEAYAIIPYSTDGESLAMKLSSRFFRELERGNGKPIPDEWANGNHPRHEGYEYVYDARGNPMSYKNIPEEDQRYLKFEYTVPTRVTKPDTEYSKFQTRAQEKQAKQQQEIADTLKELPRLLKDIKDNLT
jgi:hypothetical protein